ncbi:hypothetical protein ACDQ55_18100 [Chitinophaga sp. 30R24]|uniref:hypothetical protein n=1 Tax=Chitinophaga sp. 30R24 TaxID=3248838 RepID=UPI003B8FFD72
MMKLIFFFVGIVTCILLGMQCEVMSQQAISGLQCKVSPAPNYSLTKNQSQAAFLTDGKYSGGLSMWKDSGTLGWQNINQITIDLTLPRLLTVGAIMLNSVTGQKAQVNLPLNVLAFISSDAQHWQFAGDLVQPSVQDEYYRIVPLTLQGIGITGRYIKLVVVPNGSYFFTDEVQVFTGNENIEKKSSPLTTDGLNAFVARQREETISKRFANSSNKQDLSANKQMAAATGKGISLWLLSSPLADAGSNSVATNVIVHTLKGFSEYAAFVLNNATAATQTVQVSFPALEQGISYQLYWAKPVKSRDFKIVPDALMPVKNGAAVVLSPNESKLLLVKAIAANKGTYLFKLSAGAESQQVTFAVGARSLADYRQYKPDVNVWPYFNEPFFNGREEQARQDLLQHDVNTYVFHPGILLPGTPVDKNEKLKKYLSYVKGFQNVLLFFNLTGKENNFISAAFLSWYDDMVAALQRQGIAAEHIYLYPFDEIKPAQLPAFKQFTSAIKQARKNAKIFVTVSNGMVLNSLAGQADILQLYDNDNVLRAYRELGMSAKRVWLYDTKKPTKSLSPYAYYRLMAWKAFANNLTGIGFWQYADAGHDKNARSLWDDFDGSSADFAVVYDDGQQVVSSRRWEGFKMGVEDYMLLQAYAQRFGKSAAAKRCQEVLSDASNPQTGDRARTQMINELEK